MAPLVRLSQKLDLINFSFKMRNNALNFVNGDDDWSDYLSMIQYTYNTTPDFDFVSVDK